jgi:hypothetical protein
MRRLAWYLDVTTAFLFSFSNHLLQMQRLLQAKTGTALQPHFCLKSQSLSASLKEAQGRLDDLLATYIPPNFTTGFVFCF